MVDKAWVVVPFPYPQVHYTSYIGICQGFLNLFKKSDNWFAENSCPLDGSSRFYLH